MRGIQPDLSVACKAFATELEPLPPMANSSISTRRGGFRRRRSGFRDVASTFHHDEQLGLEMERLLNESREEVLNKQFCQTIANFSKIVAKLGASPIVQSFCSSDLPKGKEILTFHTESHVNRIDVLLRVLAIVQQLLQENKQGLVMGWLRFSEAEKNFNCINRPSTAHSIPVHVEEVKDIVSVASYILVVEKESVFQRLADDQFCSTNRCIVITGRGYPDIPTRRFLRLLIDTLHLPAYCLVDCDPYGFDILCTYRFGSMQMAYDAKFLRVPKLRWLGAFPSDSEKYHLPKQCLLPLTTKDKKRTEALLLRCYLQREEPLWRLELETMLQKGVKFEIEALSVHSLSFLSSGYIPSKIQGGEYI